MVLLLNLHIGNLKTSAVIKCCGLAVLFKLILFTFYRKRVSIPRLLCVKKYILYSVLRIRDIYPWSRILIFVHPESRIPDPPTSTKEGRNKSLLSYLFCCHAHMTQFKFDLFLNRYRYRKKIWANSQRIIGVFGPKKMPLSSQKYGFGIRDPGSIKNLFRIPDLRSRGQKGIRSRVVDPYSFDMDPDPIESGSGSATLRYTPRTR